MRGQEHDAIVFVNDLAVLPPAMISGVNIWTVSGSNFVGRATLVSGASITSPSIDGGSSGMAVTGPISTTATLTAAKSGTFAPLNWLVIQVSGQSVKVPYFAV